MFIALKNTGRNTNGFNGVGRMKYTFDDAVKQWNKGSANGPLVSGIMASPLRNVPQQEYDRVKFMNRLFYSIIEQLREEYAPTVEMTKSEYEIFSKAKVNEDSADWLDAVEWDRVGYKYPEFFAAWLHPETIKVVDE